MSGLTIFEDRAALSKGPNLIHDLKLLDHDVTTLQKLTSRYQAALRLPDPTNELCTIGTELWHWAQGDVSALTRFAKGVGPVEFTIQADFEPSAAEWAVLRAPWELLFNPKTKKFVVPDQTRPWHIIRRIGDPEPSTTNNPHRLGIAFMVGAPPEHDTLDFEAEESAMLTAIGATPGRDGIRRATTVDLLIEDSGNPDRLHQKLNEQGSYDVVHVSCHGTAGSSESTDSGPVLLLEDDLGQENVVTPPDLVSRIQQGTNQPQLVFLSACQTSQAANHAGEVAHSFASHLVAAGVPLVLGWAGSVADQHATQFAQHFYTALARTPDVATAVAQARVGLRAQLSGEKSELSDPSAQSWHMAQLWAGPLGGQVHTGNRPRPTTSPTAGTTTYLAGKKDVPVASPEMFVGRRRELQSCLRGLESVDHSGILIHGMGRLGKSSLAARVIDRLETPVVAVVFGEVTATTVLDALREATKTNSSMYERVQQADQDFRAHKSFASSLRKILNPDPLAEVDQPPVVLILDDFEQNLESNPEGRHTVTAKRVEAIQAVFSAFTPGHTPHKLLITSRYQFTCAGVEKTLFPVPLAAFNQASKKRLLERQIRKAQIEPGTQDNPEAKERFKLAEQGLDLAAGIPGLQDLLVTTLALNAAVPTSVVAGTFTEMATTTQKPDFSAAQSHTEVQQLQDLLSKLAISSLLDVAGSDGQVLLRALTIFDIPVPESTVQELAGELGGSPGLLISLGLLDVMPLKDAAGGYTRAASAERLVQVNPLAARYVDALSDEEHKTIATLVLPSLIKAWPQVLDVEAAPVGVSADLQEQRVVQIGQLALNAGNIDTLEQVAGRTAWILYRRNAHTALEFGLAAIELFKSHAQQPPLGLYRHTIGSGVSLVDSSLSMSDCERILLWLNHSQKSSART